MCSMNAVLVGLLFEGAARALPLGSGRLLGKQRPRDTRVLGRDRDAGTVISATLAYRKGPSGQWIGQACSPLQYGERRGYHRACIAIAAKNARVAWALLAK